MCPPCRCGAGQLRLHLHTTGNRGRARRPRAPAQTLTPAAVGGVARTAGPTRSGTRRRRGRASSRWGAERCIFRTGAATASCFGCIDQKFCAGRAVELVWTIVIAAEEVDWNAGKSRGPRAWQLSPESPYSSPLRKLSTELKDERRTPWLVEIWRRALPSLPLLPIFGAYAVASLVVSAARADEHAFLGYATNLTHGFYAQTQSPNPAAWLWHGPALPTLLAPLVALHVSRWCDANDHGTGAFVCDLAGLPSHGAAPSSRARCLDRHLPPRALLPLPF